MSALLAVVLAGGESKKSGPIGLAVILVLCVACYFLFKSMSKHLRKVREEFPAEESASPPPSDTAAPPSAEEPSPSEAVDEQPPG